MKIINNPMKKRGQMEISAVIIFLLVTGGVIAVIYDSKHIFVGDIKTKYVLDYYLCPDQVKSISQQNQILFESKSEAILMGYKEKSGCV